MHLTLFSKMFHSMPIEYVGDTAAQLGFDGVDLSVRQGGHVLPENVATDLPRAVKVLKARGIGVPMITTNITTAADPCAETIFRAAGQQGIEFLKLGYYRYRGFGHIRQQIMEIRSELRGVLELGHQYGVRIGIHIHSGDSLPAEGGILDRLLEGFDPATLGAYIDPGHMTLEGGVSGWKMGMDILSDRIAMVGVKDFTWRHEPDPKTGEPRWVPKIAPLGAGLVRWKEVIGYLKQAGFNGCVSLHSEYSEPYSFRKLTLAENIEQTRRDLAFFRELLSQW